MDTSEEALLIPDWLKLKMIRSSVGVLVDSALKDLDPQQLVLFIQVGICSPWICLKLLVIFVHPELRHPGGVDVQAAADPRPGGESS